MALYEFNPDDADRFALQVGIPARKHGRELIFKKCPYCRAYSRDKDKFSINLTTGQFQCFRASCQAKGNMITLAKDFNFSLGNEADEYYRGIRKFKNISGRKKSTSKPAVVAFMEKRGKCFPLWASSRSDTAPVGTVFRHIFHLRSLTQVNTSFEYENLHMRPRARSHGRGL